ncbi:MAG: Nif11 family protein [Synergistaceae bacterium]|nr:Nif11 family protein [Synergistaceae bacterium]
MNENLKALAEKVMADDALQAKFAAVKNADEAYELASSVVHGFSKDEFVSFVKDMQSAAKAGGKLTDEELGQAAGGFANPFDLSANILANAVNAKNLASERAFGSCGRRKRNGRRK